MIQAKWGGQFLYQYEFLKKKYWLRAMNIDLTVHSFVHSREPGVSLKTYTLPAVLLPLPGARSER